MAFSKARRLSDFIAADGTIPTGKFASSTITSAHIVDGTIAHADLHTNMDLTGKTVLVANASTGDNDTTAANTAFVQQEIAALVDSSPSALNTLNELAAALGDDANFSTTVTNSIATKLPLAGGALTGALTTNSTIDGRNVSTDGTKLDTIETNADITDTANVTSAGALMDSELTDIASIKALNQGVATTDDPTFTNTKLAAIAASNSDTAVDVFVYDTSKDSDGGAWRKRTQHTSWYNEALNTSTRGARKEFPSVAVIVAESTQVTIYDGDDPAMPMWMVFNKYIPGFLYTTVTCAKMLNGILFIGVNPGSENYYDAGVKVVGFLSDTLKSYSYALGLDYHKPVSERNMASTAGLSTEVSLQIVNPNVNDIAVTVLPNAPIDADTGLPVPTIAVATNSGVSVIKDDGNVVDITSNSYAGAHQLGLVGQRVYYSNIGTQVVYSLEIPESDVNFSGYNSLTSGSITRRAFSSLDHGGFLSQKVRLLGTNASSNYKFSVNSSNKAFGSSETGYGSPPRPGLTLLDENMSSQDNSMVSYITSDYNTGWMHGDIKLATLSDTDTTNAVGTEILTNTNFTSGTSPWVAVQASISAGSNKLTITPNSAVNGGVYHAITTVVGKTYVYQLKVLADASNLARMFAGTGNDINSANKSDLASKFSLGTGTHSITFVATGTTTYIWIEVGGGTQQATEFDDATVRLAEADRSYNGNGLQVFGTITKTAVATGAELVAYRGFSSTAGYSPNGTRLQQPYNAGYDFTGDFSISYWVKGINNDTTVHWSDASGNDGWMIYHNANTSYFVDGTWDSYLAYQQVNSVTSLTGAWTKVEYIRRGGSLYYYLDAVLKHTYNSIGGWALTNTTAHQLAVYAGNTTNAFALLRISATAPTPEQIAKMYNDEKHLFSTNAKAKIAGTSDAVTALAYDDDTELLHVGSSWGRSVFQGLNRVEYSTDVVSTAISASNGFIVED